MSFPFGKPNTPAGNSLFGGGGVASGRGFSSIDWTNYTLQLEKQDQSKRDPLGEVANSLARLFASGSYSDLTITCGSDRYKVHRAIVCPRSTFFEAACNGAFKEAETREIDLPDDDPLAVKMMVHYLYHLDYQPPATPIAGQLIARPESQSVSAIKQLRSDTFSLPVEEQNGQQSFNFNSGWQPYKEEKCSGKESSDKTPGRKQSSNLALHVKMYALGEKYDLSDLKTLAVEKFEHEVKGCWDTDDFLAAAQEVYTSTVEHDRPMRDLVVTVLSGHSSLLDDKKAQDVMRNNDLAFDLLMRLRKDGRV